MTRATEDCYASGKQHDFSHNLRETVRAERQPLINQIVNHQERRTTRTPFCYVAMEFLNEAPSLWLDLRDAEQE